MLRGSMTIEEIIREKPHLRDTLALYEKVLRFYAAVADLTAGTELEGETYPTELVDPVLEVFASSFDLPGETLSPLREAMKSRLIDLTRLPKGEIPGFSLPYHEDELATILFLISRPFFDRLRQTRRVDNAYWEGGKCPLCTAKPSLAAIDDEGRRSFSCSFCGTVGLFKRVGCPACLTQDASKITLFTAEEERGVRIDGCDLCGSYIKTVMNVDFSGSHPNPDLVDLVTMPLDIVAQEKGYRRQSPNPIGITRMV